MYHLSYRDRALIYFGWYSFWKKIQGKKRRKKTEIWGFFYRLIRDGLIWKGRERGLSRCIYLIAHSCFFLWIVLPPLFTSFLLWTFGSWFLNPLLLFACIEDWALGSPLPSPVPPPPSPLLLAANLAFKQSPIVRASFDRPFNPPFSEILPNLPLVVRCQNFIRNETRKEDNDNIPRRFIYA